jgi:hypothetical protein
MNDHKEDVKHPPEKGLAEDPHPGTDCFAAWKRISQNTVT